MKNRFVAVLLGAAAAVLAACSTNGLPSSTPSVLVAPSPGAHTPAQAAAKARHLRPHGEAIALAVSATYSPSPGTVGQIVKMDLRIQNINRTGPTLTGIFGLFDTPIMSGITTTVAGTPTTNCPSGTAAGTVGTWNFTISGATLKPGESCDVFVPIVAPVGGTYQDTTGYGAMQTDQLYTNGDSPTSYLTINAATPAKAAHLYVPVASANFIRVYAIGPMASPTPQFTIETPVLSAPSAVAIDQSGTMYVNNQGVTGQVVVIKNVPSSASGIYTPKSSDVSTINVGSAVYAITVDSHEFLVATTAGGAYWYDSLGTLGGSVPVPAGKSWTTATADDRSVLLGDTEGYTVSSYNTTNGPPPPGATPICAWSAKNAAVQPNTTATYDAFTIVYSRANGQVYYAADYSQYANGPVAPFVDESFYGYIRTTGECNSAVIASLISPASPITQYPAGNGNTLTLLGGFAIDPNTGNVAVSTIPNLNSTGGATAAKGVAGVNVWNALSGSSTSNPNATGTPKGYTGTGATIGKESGIPWYGP